MNNISLISYLIFCPICLFVPWVVIYVLDYPLIHETVSIRKSYFTACLILLITIPLACYLLIEGAVSGFVLETYLLTGSLFLLTSVFLAYSEIKKRHASTLTITLFLGGIASFMSFFQEKENFEYLRWLPFPFNTNIGIKQVVIFVYSLLFLAVFFLLYYFYEQMYSLQPNPVRLAVMSSFIGIAAITGLITTLELVLGIPKYYGDFLWISPDRLWDASYSCVLSFPFLFGSFVYYRAFQATNEKRSLILVSAMGIGAASNIIATIHWDFEIRIFGILGDLISDYRGIAIALPIFILVCVYLSDLDFIYRMPFNIFAVLFFAKETGLPVHLSRFAPISEESIDDSLITGLISALNSFLKQTLGSQKENLQILLSEHKAFIFSSSNSFMVVCLADKGTVFLKHSLDTAIKEFERDYAMALHSFGEEVGFVDSSLFETAYTIIERNFPYAVFINRKNESI